MQAVLPIYHAFVGAERPILVDAVYWDGRKASDTSPAWFSPALNKGPTEDGGGLMRMDNDIHLFPPGLPANPLTCKTVKPGNWFFFVKDYGWSIVSDDGFKAMRWTTKEIYGLTFHFESAPRERFARYGIGLSQTRSAFDDENDSLWWVHDLQRWVGYDEFHSQRLAASSMKDIRTFRALRSHLRRHRESLKGRTMVWATRFDQLYVRIPA